MSVIIDFGEGYELRPISTYELQDVAYNYAVGGLPFLSAEDPETPLRRRTTPFQREQIDQDREAGENSLSGYWLRSQSSFHGGAGQKWLDGGDDTEVRRIRFDMSRGVNVTNPGQVYPLPVLDQKATGDYSPGILSPTNGGLMAIRLDAGVPNLYALSYSDSGAVTANLVSEASRPTAYSIVTNGIYYFLARDNGVFRGTNGLPSAPDTMYTTGGGGLYLAWLKHRLMASGGRSLYELDWAATGAALPAAFYTHPSNLWLWNGWADGPNGMFVSGYTSGAGAAGESAIYHIGLDNSVSPPTLDAPIQVLQLPPGEQVKDKGIFGFADQYLIVCTNKGVRVCTIGTNGTLTAGPLNIDLNDWLWRSSWNLGGIAAANNKVYLSVNGANIWDTDELGTLCINLGVSTGEGTFAWSAHWTAATETSTPKGLVFDTYNSPCIPTSTGIWRPYATFSAGAHKLITSGMRYSTEELKHFESFTVETNSDYEAGTLRVYPFYNTYIGDTFFMTPYPNYLDIGSGTDRYSEKRIDDTWAGKVHPFIKLEFWWRPDPAWPYYSTPILKQYQMRALPNPKRQRTETIPLLMFDFEKDANGNLVGEDGRAWGRLLALEAMEETGRPVTLQRFGSEFSSADDEMVVIESVEFVQTTAPTHLGSGFGGLVLLTVRKVADA